MLRAANSIYSPHFAIWPEERNILERAVCHLAACSDNNVDSAIFFFCHCLYFSLELGNAQKNMGPTKDSVRCITLRLHNNWKVLLAPGCFLELQIDTFVD